ncbi:MAG: GatB/YqeY domain-containing protein [Candidatus Acidiferrales bacterium]
MTLTERIQNDLTQAMKAKDELRLSVLRMMKSAIKNKEIEKIRPLDDAEALQVLNTLVKQRRESVEMFGKGGRQDLVEKETKEIAIIETYLPAGASGAELDAAIAAAIAETGANSPKQMGAVIKAARAHLEGKTVDGKALSDRVRDILSKPA